MKRVSEMKVRRLSASTEAKLDGTVESSRYLYNAALEQRIDAYRKRGKTLSFYDQCKELTALRADDPTYAAMDSTMTRLTVLRRLDLAFKAFFRRLKAGEKPGFPRFKGRGRFDTLVFGTSGWKLAGRRLTVRGVGTLKITKPPHRDGEPVGLRLVRRCGRWFAQFVLDIGDAPAVRQAEHGAGIDVGLRTFATMNDGSTIEHPRFVRAALEKLKVFGQALSRKTRGSKRRLKAKALLVAEHGRVANRRRDFIRQAVAWLAKHYDGFAVEDLKIQEMAEADDPEGMSPNGARGLRRGIMDSGWRSFADALGAKAEEAGFPFMRVEPKGTSQRCSGCGSVVRKTLRDRWHDCLACGLSIDRDVNAARNIYDLGWRSAAETAAECPA